MRIFLSLIVIACVAGLTRPAQSQTLSIDGAAAPKKELLRKTPQLKIVVGSKEFERQEDRIGLSNHDDLIVKLRVGRPLVTGAVRYELSRNGVLVERRPLGVISGPADSFAWKDLEVDLRGDIQPGDLGDYRLRLLISGPQGARVSDPVIVAYAEEAEQITLLPDHPGPTFEYKAFVDLFRFRINASQESTSEPYLVAYIVVFDDHAINIIDPGQSKVRLISSKGTHGNLPNGPGVGTGLPISKDTGYFEFDLRVIGHEEWLSDPFVRKQASLKDLINSTTVSVIATALEENAVATSVANDIKRAVAKDTRAEMDLCLDLLNVFAFKHIRDAAEGKGKYADGDGDGEPERKSLFRALEVVLTGECILPADPKFSEVLNKDRNETLSDITFFDYLRRRGNAIAERMGIKAYTIGNFGLGPVVQTAVGLPARVNPDEMIGSQIKAFTLPQLQQGQIFKLRFQLDEDLDRDNEDHVRAIEEGTWVFDYEWDYEITGRAGLCDMSAPRRGDGRCRELR